jgi:hypothetical protein
MTKFRLPNDLNDGEARELLRILREQASTFLDWGYDETSFWVGLDAQGRNPWPNLLRELTKRANNDKQRHSPSIGLGDGRAVA